ncbi:uncharacterized protein A4U43_C01F34460 [Asparagus officinalis]|uniref:Uncharacterized protein n=1 Tax=Asparagus officinalis TaxID=4686 RepID=A0A5P1FUM2_ASPOF|nr:uncharacterized protein LOC109845577 [Asparagus officinalis]ONK81938.1 uncharacterized protein A4U43_C01F34460 [Asparagus officinalis]
MSSSSSSLLSGSAASQISSFPIKPQRPSPLSAFSWRLRREQLAYTGLQKRNQHVIRVFATARTPQGKRTKGNDIIMVDPLEAKRLAAQQMQEIKAREKRKRRRQIEAINGAWAMIGLTAGLVIEGQTGHGMLAQVAGYLEAITGLFTR